VITVSSRQPVRVTYRGVRLRSLLEYSFVKLMEDVYHLELGKDLHYEPVRISYRDVSGKERHYVPDFLTSSTLYEVKARARVYDRGTVAKNAVAAKYCAIHGLQYHVLSEASIRRLSRQDAARDPLVTRMTRKASRTGGRAGLASRPRQRPGRA